MKQTILLLTALLVAGSLAGQSNIRLSNYWMDTYFINPSALDANLSPLRFGIAHRSQWIGFQGAPRTSILSGVYFNDMMRSQFGLRAVFDKIGYTTTADVALTYAYSARFETVDINMGFGLRYQRVAYDWSQARLESSITDPALFGARPESRYNTDVGLEIVFPGRGYWVIGLSSLNLLSFIQAGQAPFANTNFLYLRYRSNHGLYAFSREKSWWDFSAAATLIHSKAIESPHVFQEEFNANLHINFPTAVLTVGLLYRTLAEAGLIVGVEWGRFNLSCVYEYPLEYARAGVVHPVGTMEAILIYKLNSHIKVSPCGRRDGRPCTGTL
ncbi:MAG: PorP/SprF family type IX secretion system membrane protein [Prevotellaceae bacterium]|jgi:type IX secretion system PorP/SprF family membrane protein|nr:PorP/SprF family type IX secretion system membrane protein [Prevotellaceae bacterium]